MRSLAALAVLLPVLVSCAHAPARPSGSQDTAPAFRIVDVLPEVWAWRDRTRGETAEIQARTLRTEVLARHPGLFGPEVLGERADFDRALTRMVDGFVAALPEREAAMRTVSARLPGQLEAAGRRFLARFPALRWDGTIYLTLSFGHFDGGGRTIDGRTALVYGVDFIATLYGPNVNVAPLFDHELTHALQPSWDGSGESPLWFDLWHEGSAVWVARTLNPDATDAELTLGGGLRPRATAMLPALARRMRERLDSTDLADARWFFSGGDDPSRGEVPARSGYVLGLAVAERIAAGRTPPEVIAMTGPALRTAVDAALAELAALDVERDPAGRIRRVLDSW